MDTPTLRNLQSLSGTYAANLRLRGPDDSATVTAYSALRLAQAKIYLDRASAVLTDADRKALKSHARGL